MHSFRKNCDSETRGWDLSDHTRGVMIGGAMTGWMDGWKILPSWTSLWQNTTGEGVAASKALLWRHGARKTK